jgi:exodeoxyribonuclease-5
MWSSEQNRALSLIDKWFKEDSRSKQIFRLFGYAGTGKTTLAKHIAEGIDGTVLFAAFSGKAAHVLTQKGCPARTIHSLIYKPVPRSQKDLRELKDLIDEQTDPAEKEKLELKLKEMSKKHKQPIFELNEESPVNGAALLVIDECSMIGKKMGNDLCSFGVPILVLGDPGQLPPIGDAGFFTAQTPDFLLSEIHRQASDNPIIHIATLARQSQKIKMGNYGGGVVVKSRKEVNADEILQADQVLLGKNETRRLWNARIRQLKFGGKEHHLPVQGDKLICLKNNSKNGLMNGSMWKVESQPMYGGHDLLADISSIQDDNSYYSDISMYNKLFLGQELSFYERLEGIDDFDYGYAITVHKSQGSQWDNVVLLDESGCFQSSKSKWIYTGITRAAKELTILL